MKTKLGTGFLLVILFSSCVSSKLYNELESRYNALKKHNSEQSAKIDDLTASNEKSTKELEEAKKSLGELKKSNEDLAQNIAGLNKNISLLQQSYDALEKNSSEAGKENLQKNRELLASLEKKESELISERQRLNNLKKELETRSKRINELESLIADKQKNMSELKNILSKALYSFEDKGLTVENRNGKVYVSMDNKLLFSSGSWTITADGKKAVNEVGKVLATHKDIALIIEGHTDNIAYTTNGNISDNWDLSTKRATEIVRLLQTIKGIDLKNITAAGRGEFSPIAPNETGEGRAKNRRIEFILSPKLDKLSDILNEK